MISVVTCATKRYSYSLPNFGRRISTALQHHKKGCFIFVGDESDKIKEQSHKYISEILPKGWEFVFIPIPVEDEGLRNYKEDAQMLIAQMQSVGFTEARKRNSKLCWSVESDVLVPPNALKVSEDTLKFDDGYYDVAMVSYPSQGGGSFLGGRGSFVKHIEDDVMEDERDIPKELEAKLKKRQKEARQKSFNPDKEWIKEGLKLKEEIKKCPPKGNVFELNAKRWKKRGWMEHAYPAIGRGAILPTDWVGFGCTLMSKKALSLAHFDGYFGKGTQDLHICWNFWNPNELKMAVITHVLCDHIVRSRDGEDQKWDKFVHVMAYHEQMGDTKGHLRQSHRPFYQMVAGEQYDESNDGVVSRPSKEGESSKESEIKED